MKLDTKETGYEGMDWTVLKHDTVQQQFHVKMVMNFWIS
jgi:hypothetical protein